MSILDVRGKYRSKGERKGTLEEDGPRTSPARANRLEKCCRVAEYGFRLIQVCLHLSSSRMSEMEVEDERTQIKSQQPPQQRESKTEIEELLPTSSTLSLPSSLRSLSPPDLGVSDVVQRSQWSLV